jgi:hypothetical protein
LWVPVSQYPKELASIRRCPVRSSVRQESSVCFSTNRVAAMLIIVLRHAFSVIRKLLYSTRCCNHGSCLLSLASDPPSLSLSLHHLLLCYIRRWPHFRFCSPERLFTQASCILGLLHVLGLVTQYLCQGYAACSVALCIDDVSLQS